MHILFLSHYFPPEVNAPASRTYENTKRWVKAGHEPAILCTPGADSYELLTGEGLPLGVMEDAAYLESQKQLYSGQIILVLTDGIKESVNPHGEMFGNDRLLEAIRNRGDKSAKEIIDSVFESLNNFRHPLEADDDETLVVIKVL